MTSGFQKLKEDSSSGKSLKKHQAKIASESQKKRFAKDRAFIIQSLRSFRDFESINALESCKSRSYCGYVYCDTCATRLGKKLHKRFDEHIDIDNCNRDDMRKRLRFVTILHSLPRLKTDEVTLETKSFRKELNNFRRKWNNTWAQGAIEYELIDMSKVNRLSKKAESNTRKTKTLMNLIDPQYKENNFKWKGSDIDQTHYVLVHAHFLMDANEEDWKAIKDDLKKRWKGSYRTLAETLHAESKTPFEVSVRTIANYLIKYSLKYKYEFDNYAWEDSIDDDSKMSKLEVNSMFNLYKDMSGINNKGLLLGWSSS